ncbi:signal peptidase I [Specibacter sp. NPDC057265]|uniref:signal peptidase I n=1 Tax=Specibacter sp. NPDC057265 TaxID=3346075 RepID=UPI00363C8B86
MTAGSTAIGRHTHRDSVPLTRRTARRERERTGVLWWIAQTTSWLVLLVVLALTAVMIVIPSAGGATAYTVLTGSMRPGLPPGTLAVIQPVDPADIRTGDVITYQLKSGEPTVVTHRVVGVGATTHGEQRLTLRGDANNMNDPVILPEQVRGRLWYSVPLLGFVNSAITGQQRALLLGLSVAALLGYAAFMSLSALRDHLGRSKNT